MTRVLVVDDRDLLRVGLRKILEAEPDLEVVGDARHGLEAIEVARTAQPDLVLMDIRMPVLDGITATARIVGERPGTRVLILTTFGLDAYVFDALHAGASGFMLKDAPPEELVSAVRVVAAGESLLAPAVTRAVVEEFVRRPRLPRTTTLPGLDELTAREREVFDLLVQGCSNSEICARLVISDATAKTHVARILQKLGVRDRVQVVIAAYESGLAAPGR